LEVGIFFDPIDNLFKILYNYGMDKDYRQGFEGQGNFKIPIDNFKKICYYISEGVGQF